MLQQEPIDPARLAVRVQHYAAKAGAAPSSTQQMLQLLASPLGQSILQLASSGPQGLLPLLLVNDLYKVHMQSLYAQYMTGVCGRGERWGLGETGGRCVRGVEFTHVHL